MVDLSRRRLLAVLAVTLAGLGFRRAVARPERIQPPPLMGPVPWPLEVWEKQEYCLDGVWIEDFGHRIYSPRSGWVHVLRPTRQKKLASWYGPPPPYGKPVKDYGNGSTIVRV